MRNIVRPRALKKIKADHSLYARDYDRFTYEREWGPYANRQFPDENWTSSDYDMDD